MKIYVASRASVPERSAMWRQLRSKGWNIISTWIDEAGEGDTEDFTELWDRIQREVEQCQVLICYLERDDLPLKGALVEVGMALSQNKLVLVVIPNHATFLDRNCRPVGSWIKHPNCIVMNSIEGALNLIRNQK